MDKQSRRPRLNPMSDLARIVRPIVEGQLRSYFNDHPEIADAYAGKRRPGKSKVDALVDSIGKRISNDLTCAGTGARLRAALLEPSSDAPSGELASMRESVASR